LINTQNPKTLKQSKMVKKNSTDRNLPDIPVLSNPEIISTDCERGPRVPTIFVIAGKKDCHERKNQAKKISEIKVPAQQINAQKKK